MNVYRRFYYKHIVLQKMNVSAMSWNHFQFNENGNGIDLFMVMFL